VKLTKNDCISQGNVATHYGMRWDLNYHYCKFPAECIGDRILKI